jgi:hypothetical protein
MASLSYKATIHIHPRGHRALQVATARVEFINRDMVLCDIQTPDGMCWEGPVEPDELGRMLLCDYLIILEGGRTYRVSSAEMSDRWYVRTVKS